nr:ribonuclease H-like domain-containing protein [Tanacetum cinerariifolium]
MLKVDVAPLAPKLRNNRKVHSDYLKHTQKETATLREIVEHERSLNPLNTFLDYACKYTKRIQELLIIIRQTCPCINNLGDKLIVVTPMNKTKRVRFIDPITSSGNINIKTTSSSNVVSNKPMLSSTGVNLSTSASGSQPSVKETVKRKVWKPTGKVFTNIGYMWRPTGRTFTIVGNACPLTRITTTTKVPLRKPIALESNPPKPIVTLVYSRKPKASRNNVPYLDSGCSKHMTGDHSQLTNFIDKFLDTVKFDTNQEKLYLLHMDLCGLMRVESVNGKKYILVIIDDYSRFTWFKCLRSLGPALHEMTPATIRSGLVPIPTSSTTFIPPSRTDWDLLFQPLFNELLNPLPSIDHPAPKVISPIAEVVALELAASTGLPSSTTVDQDAPSPSNSQ